MKQLRGDGCMALQQPAVLTAAGLDLKMRAHTVAQRDAASAGLLGGGARRDVRSREGAYEYSLLTAMGIGLEVRAHTVAQHQ